MKFVRYAFALVILFLCAKCKTTTEPGQAEQTKEWLTYEGQADMPKVVLISGDEEYRSEEALSQLAKILSSRHGFNCTVLFAQDPAMPGIVNPNFVRNIPGTEALDTADLMVIFTRFRALPDQQILPQAGHTMVITTMVRMNGRVDLADWCWERNGFRTMATIKIKVPGEW